MNEAMDWNMTVEDCDELLPEGEYPATVSRIEDMEGMFGPMIRITFAVQHDDEPEPREVSGLANTKFSENSKLGRWVSAILGYMPEVGTKVTVKDILDKPCCIVVKHKTHDDGSVFANVKKVVAKVPF